MQLILASVSPYRKILLDRLRLPFSCRTPDVDEAVLLDEAPAMRARRLAYSKAASATPEQSQRPTLVIGSDQVACLGDQILRKPSTAQRAAAQLALCSGKSIIFWTGVSVISSTGQHWHQMVRSDVTLRHLSSEEIKRYIELDKPLSCAGSFKWESLGISLFQRLETPDPTALEGLPLIALCELLREAGLSVPLASQPR
tara:strand:- start:113 stop:709 length:597 start_codon:yes stop_codon:yes gene_type:complete